MFLPCIFFFFKQKTAYVWRISDWISDVCSSDLVIAEDLSTMQLRVSVDEADVGQVKRGQRATFTVDAYPGRRFPATVERIALASNTTATSNQQQQQGQQGNTVINYEARLARSDERRVGKECGRPWRRRWS